MIDFYFAFKTENLNLFNNENLVQQKIEITK